MPDEMTLQSVPGFDTFLEHEKKNFVGLLTYRYNSKKFGKF